MQPGDKIYIFNKEATKLKIYGAPEGSKFYFKVPDGKILSGKMELKDK